MVGRGAQQVEVDITTGQPMISVMGLPDAAVRESRDRSDAGNHTNDATKEQ